MSEFSHIGPAFAASDVVDRLPRNGELISEHLSGFGRGSDSDHIITRQFRQRRPADVFGMCHRLKVIWTYARRLFAKVIQLQTFRNLPDLLFVHGSVRADDIAVDGRLVMSELVERPSGGYPTWRRVTAILNAPHVRSDLSTTCRKRSVMTPVTQVFTNDGSSLSVALSGDASFPTAATLTESFGVRRRDVRNAASVVPVTTNVGSFLAFVRPPGVDASVLSTTTTAEHDERLAVLGGDGI